VANNWFSPKTWLLSFGAACALLACASVIGSRSYISHKALNLDESARITNCTSEVLTSLKPQPQIVDLPLIEHLRYSCYQEIYNEDSLTDWGIRKSAYLNQQVQTPVMLWMVVTITISGVLLAGLQLVAAYRLASAGKAAFEQGGQLNIEHNKISLSSSVTGLMILAVSFAFFIVFVSKVYLIQETQNATAAAVAPAAPAAGLQPQYAFVGTPEARNLSPCQPSAVASPKNIVQPAQQSTRTSQKSARQDQTPIMARPLTPPIVKAKTPPPNKPQ
jgi:hypothetical protein